MKPTMDIPLNTMSHGEKCTISQIKFMKNEVLQKLGLKNIEYKSIWQFKIKV